MEMTELDRVFDAFRNCISEPKCKNCPWTECDKLKERRVEIPIDLALAVMRILKVEEPVEPVPGLWDRDIQLYKCGACGGEIGAGEIAKYCFHCGRAVKWE